MMQLQLFLTTHNGVIKQVRCSFSINFVIEALKNIGARNLFC